MNGDSNLYIARVLSFDPVSKDTQLLIPQLQGTSPIGAQAYINRYEELAEIPDLIAGERVLVFFDGGDTNSQAYWMVVYAGIEGPPGPPGDVGPGGGEIGDHVAQPDPHTQYQLESAMVDYYTKIEAEAAFISPAEQIAFQGDYYNKTEVDNALLNYLSKAGGTMSGYITLHASPQLPTHPATKIYVDNHINATDPHPLIQIALGGQTTGNYVASIQGTLNQISVSGSGTEQAAVTLSLPQNIDTLATPTFKSLTLTQVPGLPPFNVTSNTRVPNLNASQLEGRDSNYLLAWENFINKPDPIVTVSLSGALSGSGTTTWTDMAGNLVVDVAATLSTGSGSQLNADLLDSLDSTYFLNAGNLNAGTVLPARLNGVAGYAFNLTGALTGNASTATTLQTARLIAGKSFNGSANVVLSALTAGTGITPAGQYDGSAAVTFNVDGTALNTANKVVMRDGTGGFAAGAITATDLISPRLNLSLADGGLAPMTVTSRVKVNNLNADLLDGKDSIDFANRAEMESLLGDLLYVGVYDAAAYTPANRYFPFNATTPNTITGWTHDPPVDASVDLRCDFTIPIVGAGVTMRPITGSLIFAFSNTALTSFIRLTDGSYASVATNYTAIPGWPSIAVPAGPNTPATPAILNARIQLRAAWDAATDQLTHYWRLSEPGLDLLDNQVDPTAPDQAALRPWKQIGTPFTYAGKLHWEVAAAQTIGGAATFYYTGNIYRVATLTNGAVTFDMSASNAAPAATTFSPTVGTTLTLVGAGMARPELRPTPDWSGGPALYRDGMYWVVGSIGILDYIDSDLSGRYNIDDKTVTARQGDWIIAVNNGYAVTSKTLSGNVATLTLSATHNFVIGEPITVQDVDAVFNGTFTVSATTATTVSYAKVNNIVVQTPTTGRAFGASILKNMVFQYIQFSAETFVRSQIVEHSNQIDPHPLAGYIKKVGADRWYAPIDHEHDEEIAEYIVQHTERTVYDIVEFSAVGPTGGADFGILTLKLATAQHNFYRGSGISVSFPFGSYTEYNGMATVQTVAGSTITVNTKGPTRATTAGPVTGVPPTYSAKLTAEPHPDYLLITTGEQTYAKADHNHATEISAAIALHATPNTDPHPEYLNISRAALRYEKLGAVQDHIGDQNAHHNLYYTRGESDARYSATALLADHLTHPDPHPIYLTEKEGTDLFSFVGHDHDKWYFRQEKVLELIAAATPQNILATDGAASARVWLGDRTPTDPKPGDLWVQSDPVTLQPPVPPVALAAVALTPPNPLIPVFNIRLSWNAWPASTSVQSVTVQMSPTGAPGSYVTLTPPPALNAVSYDVTGLAEDIHYWFRVTAVNSVSNPVVESRNWGYVDVYTQNLNPPVPAGVAISTTTNPVTPTTARLSWTQPAGWVDPGAAGVRYEVAIIGVTPIPVPAANVVGTSGFFDFTGLTEVTAYQPSVRSVDRSGLRSAWVTVNVTTTNAPPPVPGAITITTNSPTAPQVTGTWSKYAGTIPDFAYYEVQLLTGTTVLATTNTTALTWTAPETTFGTAVTMKVRTVDVTGGVGGVSAFVQSAAVTTKAAVTVTPTSSGGSPNDQMTITWPTVTGLDNFSGYEVVLYRAGVVAETADVAANVTSRGWSNLSWGVSYYATVRVKRSVGTAPAAGPASTARTMLVDPVPTITAGGSGQTVSGTVTAPTMPSTGSPNMAVELWYRGGNYIATQYLGAGTANYSWGSLPWGTGYSTRVITTRADGYQWGSWSGWAQADTGPVPDTTPPALPTGLDCRPAGGYGAWHATMAWPGDSVGCHVDRLYSGEGYWLNIYAGAPTGDVYLGTGSAGQSMQFRARSHDAAGNWSGYAYSNTYTLAASPTGVACINTDTWRGTNGGQYNADGTKRPIQGYFSDPNWNAVGMFYYGDNIRNACAGKTVVGMRVLLVRYNGGGNSGEENVNLLLHDVPFDPGPVSGVGSPNGYLPWTPGTLAWNGVKWFGVNNFHYFWAASARGFCVYNGGKPYVVYASVDANGYQGAVEIDHYG